MHKSADSFGRLLSRKTRADIGMCVATAAEEEVVGDSGVEGVGWFISDRWKIWYGDPKP